MSVLLKAGEAGERPILPFAMLVPEPSAETRHAERGIEERIEALEALIAKLEREHAEALTAAREEGARSALEERSDAEEKVLEALQQTLDDAGEAWRSRLEAWNGPAAGIASAVLKKLFDDTATGSLAPLLESIVKQRLDTLDKRSLVALRVSAKDFADEEARSKIGALAAANHARLAIDDELGAGECLIDLKLGHIDLSLCEQWRQVEALLAEIEAEGFEP